MVAIKDMEMPKNCYACKLTYYDEAMNRRYSKTKHVVEFNSNERADDCPLVEIEERKVGKWIMTHDYFTGAYESIDYVKCSCCHEDSLEEGDYCPNCGVEMKGDKNE